MIFVGEAKGIGRGIFTDKRIASGHLIERCPVIVIPAADTAALDATVLYDYYFAWCEEREDIAIGLGYASLYNHSFTPNACYELRHDRLSIDFVALQDIAAGQQILVNYNGDPQDRSPLWNQDKIRWVATPDVCA